MVLCHGPPPAVIESRLVGGRNAEGSSRARANFGRTKSLGWLDSGGALQERRQEIDVLRCAAQLLRIEHYTNRTAEHLFPRDTIMALQHPLNRLRRCLPRWEPLVVLQNQPDSLLTLNRSPCLLFLRARLVRGGEKGEAPRGKRGAPPLLHFPMSMILEGPVAGYSVKEY